MSAHLSDIHDALNQGGHVRFDWKTCRAELILRGAKWLVDNRSYHGFLKTVAPKLERTETGSTDAKNLVIIWRKT